MKFEQKKIELNLDGKKKSIVIDLVPKWFEGIGLMFKNKGYRRRLLFSFGRVSRVAIHSLFCFYEFYAVWLDNNMNILEFSKVRPFRFSVKPRRDYRYLLELQINESNFDIINFIDADFKK